MKPLLCLLAILLASLTAKAHPGIGIVHDSRGNVFFTDLKQVWKIAPDGKKSVAVPNVHTHELCLDSEDNLYGEHLWYEGEKTNKWGHRVWCLKRDGTLVDVIPAREGFLQNYSFVRDRAGNHYWAERGAQTVIKKRAASGQISTYATGNFRDVRWMTAAADGTLYLIDQGDLRRITPAGQISTLVYKLSERTFSPSGAANRHHHMGLWLDAAGNVYVAVAGERLVMKVQADGKAAVATRSPWPWSPSGGLFDRDGNLWLLEYSLTNAVRARRINHNGAEQIF
jgi:sugar lactone lactonase YvrE